MIVTNIGRQKRNSGRVSLYIDGEFAFGIHQEVLLRSGLRKGDLLTEETLERIRASEELNLARNRALRFLSRRLRSEAEVRSDLLEREFHPETVERVVIQFRESRLLDDLRYARSFVHDARLSRALGRIMLRQELTRRGIAQEVIREALEVPGEEEEAEEAVALRAASKVLARYRASRKETPAPRQYARLSHYLARRGFAWETISSVMKQLFPAEGS